jgi:hypothetical protein
VAGVSHADRKESEAFVRSANFRRTKESRRNSITQCSYLGSDNIKPKGKVPFHVFDCDEARSDLFNNPSAMRPKVSWIVCSTTASGVTERLARIARCDAIHDSAPRSAVEGCDIVPNRSRIQGLLFHLCHDSGRGVAFPLDVTNGSVVVAEKVEGELEPADAGTNSQAIQSP